MEKNNSNKKRGKGRFKYFADYELKEVTGRNGKKRKKRVYAGDYFAYVIPKEYKKDKATFLRRIKQFYLLHSVIMIAIWTSMSFMNPPGLKNNVPYVSIIYAVLAIPLILTLFTLAEFMFKKENKFDLSFKDALTVNLRVSTIANMVGGVLCALSGIVYVASNINDVIVVEDILYIAGMIAVALTAYFFIKLQDSLPMQKL